MAYEQGANQGGNVQTVGVGIREDAHLVIAQAGEVVTGGVDPQGNGDIVYLLRGEDFL